MDLSPESFDRLMNWLHPNREEAGQEYQRIRAHLIGHFQAHGCPYPDRLADATMDRAAEKLTPEKIQKWVGEKARYFYKVAYYILQEDRSKRLLEMQMPDGFDVKTSIEFHPFGRRLRFKGRLCVPAQVGPLLWLDHATLADRFSLVIRLIREQQWKNR